jgi:hypothetical protein
MQSAPGQVTETSSPARSLESTKFPPHNFRDVERRPFAKDDMPPEHLDALIHSPSSRHDVEPATGPATRARVKAEATAQLAHSTNSIQPLFSKSLPYSGEEDKLLEDLIKQGFPWDKVAKEFGKQFAGRSLRSLRTRWSALKFSQPPPSTRCQRKRSCRA